MNKFFIFTYFVIFGLFFTSCVKTSEYPENYDSSRFQVIYFQSGYPQDLTARSIILLDKNTGKKYLFHKSGYGAGLVKLDE